MSYVPEFFPHLQTLSLPVKGFKFWSFSSEGSLACHTYCDTGHPFIMIRDTRTCCRELSSGAVTFCFNDLCVSRLRIEPRPPVCEANALPLSHRGDKPKQTILNNKLHTFIDWVRGQHAFCQTRELTKLLSAAVMPKGDSLAIIILLKKPVDKCFVIPFIIIPL